MGNIPFMQKGRLNSNIAVILFISAVCFYLARYLSYSALPEVSSKYPLGWWGWWDQSLYLRSAHALSMLDFRAESHWYPLGYPVLGAIFYKILPVHPFLLPDLLFFLGIVRLLYSIYIRFLTRWESVILVALTLFVDEITMETMVVPWNTIPTHFFIYLTTSLLVFREQSTSNFVKAALVAGAIFLCRQGDVLFVAPVFAFAAIETRDLIKILAYFSVSFLVFLPFLVITLVSNKYIFGVYLKTPYYMAATGNGFSFYNLPYKAYSLLVEAKTLYSLSTPMLLKLYPWLLLVLPGAIYAYRKYGLKVVGVLVSIFISYLYYFSYNDLDSQNLFLYLLMHYLAWTVPLLALFAYLTVRSAWSALGWRWTALLTVPVIAVIMFFGIKLKAVEWNGRVTFAGEIGRAAKSGEKTEGSVDYKGGNGKVLRIDLDSRAKFNVLHLLSWPENSSAVPIVTVDGRSFKNITDYRSIFRRDGVMLFFNRPIEAGSIEIGSIPEFQGRLSVSEIRLLSLMPDFGGVAWAAFDRHMRMVSAVKADEAGDLVGPSDKCEGDGSKDQTIRLSIRPELGRRISDIELASMGKTPGRWVSCDAAGGSWRLAVVEKAANTGRRPEFFRGGSFIVHFHDNGSVAQGSPMKLRGIGKDGEEVFSVEVK